MREFTFNQFHGWTSNYIWWWLYISCSPSLLPFQSSLSTSVQPAGCIRCIALMRLQITRYFPYKETNQIIMSFEFGLWWHLADSTSCMLLRCLRQLIGSWSIWKVWSFVTYCELHFVPLRHESASAKMWFNLANCCLFVPQITEFFMAFTSNLFV